ncbi:MULTISPECIES: OmpH family outer membrane protein [unclassified Moraxella]|uniref:OmpH family outer membrane protein n=1 Tax=unclassified Moraxella TaxID=2685852 RepID=UPI003AF9A8FE
MKTSPFTIKALSIALVTSVASLASMSSFANNVGVWNSQIAIANSNYAKAKVASVKTAVAPKQQQLQSYKANIERLQQQYDSQKDKLTQSQKDDIRKQIQTNLQNYEQVASQIQTTLEASENDVMQKIAPKMQGITEAIMKQKNMDILIDNRDRNVTYVKPEWEVTKDFIQKINEQVK